MKTAFACLFIFFVSSAFGQKGDSPLNFNIGKFSSVSISASDSPQLQTLSFLSGDYKRVEHSHTTTTYTPLGIYYRSGTIWDASEIILIDSMRFFCYYVSDIEQSCSAGYYNRKGGKYIFRADARVYKGLKGSIKLRDKKLNFSNIFCTWGVFKGDILSAFRPATAM